MDTTTFLNMILPSSGIYFAQRIHSRPGKKDATILYPQSDIADLADKLLALDEQFPADNIYYAMASYKEAQYKTTKTKDGRDFQYVVGRTQENALHVKSLWLDLDVGKEGGYPTQKDAYIDLCRYVSVTGLPSPLVVSSGYGLHVYWPFTDEVSASEWETIAKLQRAAWKHLGMKADPACDQDCARVLRAPGCTNKKSGKETRLVRVLKMASATPAQELRRILRGYIESNDLNVLIKPEVPEWAKTLTGNLDDAVTEYPDSYARIAVHHCRQIQEFSKTGGTSETFWWACIGLMKHFKDGEHYAHEWGKNYDGYTPEETDAKLEAWEAGPTTCGKFKDLNIEGCKGCKQNCRSPIQLGYDETVEKPNLLEIAAQADDKATAMAHAISDSGAASLDDGLPVGWPDRYGYDKKNDCVTVKVQDANGVWQQLKIATPLYYPVEQIISEDGTFCFKVHAWQRGKIREFLLPTKYVADPRSLKMQLASQQIKVVNDKANADFLSDLMVNMARKQEETKTYRQMGWHHDYQAWLVGDTLITKDGEKKVILSEKFSLERRDLFKPKGEPGQWVSVVDELYNRPHAEPYQFAICAAFAAPLHPLLGFSEWRGIPYALTTDESGFGKTTVNLIANSIWYDPEKGKISNSTPKAILGIASEFNNLPFLLDEVTSYLKDPGDMGDLLYSMSNGRSREGMSQEGGLRTALPPWIGCCAITGNRNVMFQVSENKLNPEAQQMRVFEIDLDVYPRIATMEEGSADYEAFNHKHRMLTQTLASECCSVVGLEYIRFIMANLDEVRKKLRTVAHKLSVNMEGDATKERFYYNLITTVLVGGYYAKKMGFINFDLNALRDWCIGHVQRLRGQVKETKRTPQDKFASLMSDMVGRIIITKNFDTLDARKGNVEMHLGSSLRSGVCGRYVMGCKNEKAQLYISVDAVQDWCSENGVAYNSLRKELVMAGLLKTANGASSTQVYIGKGVANIHGLGRPRCLVFNADKASGYILTSVETGEQPKAEVANG